MRHSEVNVTAASEDSQIGSPPPRLCNYYITGASVHLLWLPRCCEYSRRSHLAERGILPFGSYAHTRVLRFSQLDLSYCNSS